MKVTLTAKADSRYSFGPHYLWSAAMFSKYAYDIEQTHSSSIPDDQRIQFEGYIVSIIMLCVAALETEIDEVIRHGPGGHLGTNQIDKDAKAFLEPLIDLLDKQSALEKFCKVLHLLKKPTFEKGEQPFQWSIPEIVDTSKKRENAPGGVSWHNANGIPNNSKKRPSA